MFWNVIDSGGGCLRMVVSGEGEGGDGKSGKGEGDKSESGQGQGGQGQGQDGQDEGGESEGEGGDDKGWLLLEWCESEFYHIKYWVETAHGKG